MLSWRGLALVPVLQGYEVGGGSGHLTEGEVEVPQSGQLEVTIGRGGKMSDGEETVVAGAGGSRVTARGGEHGDSYIRGGDGWSPA